MLSSVQILFYFSYMYKYKHAYRIFVAFPCVSIVSFLLRCVFAKVKQLIIFVPVCDLPINNIYLSNTYYMHKFHNVLATPYIIIKFTNIQPFPHHCFYYVMLFSSCYASF